MAMTMQVQERHAPLVQLVLHGAVCMTHALAAGGAGPEVGGGEGAAFLAVGGAGDGLCCRAQMMHVGADLRGGHAPHVGGVALHPEQL